jgi:hypothetical protein
VGAQYPCAVLGLEHEVPGGFLETQVAPLLVLVDGVAGEDFASCACVGGVDSG